MKYSKNEKQHRNARIIADYLNGAKVPDMASYYKITTQRIYVIMKQYRRKSNNAKHNNSQAHILRNRLTHTRTHSTSLFL